jgi:uncharacterized protein (TIGR02996 family)
MSDEAAFLRTILDNPADDAPRLVYADWLDERGDDMSVRKARFLRTTAAHAHAVRSRSRDRKVLAQRLNGMALGLDADWLSAVSQVPVENCSLFQYQCPKRWETLATTDEPAVRFCDSCQKPVFYSKTIEEAQQHAWSGRCVAVQLGNQRKEGDLEQEFVTMGEIVVPWPDPGEPSEEEGDDRRGRVG